jgi:hypothetical protein
MIETNRFGRKALALIGGLMVAGSLSIAAPVVAAESGGHAHESHHLSR